ncbi:Peptidyl-prolyl cis-trans isomerase-like 2, partial [Ophiophagus hannah]
MVFKENGLLDSRSDVPDIKETRYITCTEYTHFYGGKKVEIPQSNFRRLPFDHCRNIVPWIKKYGTNPSTGEVLPTRALS